MSLSEFIGWFVLVAGEQARDAAFYAWMNEGQDWGPYASLFDACYLMGSEAGS